MSVHAVIKNALPLVLDDSNSIAIIWCIDDVRQVIEDYELAIELTDDECMEVLGFVDSKHDANFGISWENIYQGIEYCFADKVREMSND